jgi:hypothetical protein
VGNLPAELLERDLGLGRPLIGNVIPISAEELEERNPGSLSI